MFSLHPPQGFCTLIGNNYIPWHFACSVRPPRSILVILPPPMNPIVLSIMVSPPCYDLPNNASFSLLDGKDLSCNADCDLFWRLRPDVDYNRAFQHRKCLLGYSSVFSSIIIFSIFLWLPIIPIYLNSFFKSCLSMALSLENPRERTMICFAFR